MSHLKLVNISKSFDDFIAIDNISFEVNAGAFITLLGPSGCGKTTLLKTIAGFYTPDHGDIFIAGENITDNPPEKRNTSMCFQSYALFPHLSVRKNIAFGLEQRKMDQKSKEDRVGESMSQVDIESHALKLPTELSGGQQQRVALARAIAPRPAIILFDEPLSNLDAKLREKVRFEIRALQRELNFTAVYVTHDQSEALAMSDIIILLNKGKIEQLGTPKEIYNHPKNRFVADFIGAANIMDGKIISENEQKGSYSVETQLGILTILSNNPPQSDHLYLCWRPENGAIYQEQENETDQIENLIEAEVLNTAFLGNRMDVFAIHQGSKSQFRLELSQYYQIEKGDKIRFKIDPSHIYFLEAVHDESRS